MPDDEQRNLTDEELRDLKGAAGEPEWNAICDRVKKRCGGYPSDWYARVVASGLLARTAAGWRRR